MSYKRPFKKESGICFNCATIIPHDEILVKKTERGNILFCPICGDNQVMQANKYLDKAKNLKKYIKMSKVTYDE